MIVLKRFYIIVMFGSIATKTSTESLLEVKSEEVEKVVSCPSLPEDDHYSIGECFIIKL